MGGEYAIDSRAAVMVDLWSAATRRRTPKADMIDTHTHLTDEPLASALDEVLGRARAAGVERFIVPGYDPGSWIAGRALAERHADIRFAVGIHPLFPDAAAVDKLEREIARGGMVAIGETGLDYVDEKANHALQMRLFRRQLDLARTACLPVILHCRHAHDDLLDALRACHGVRGVMHSCSCSNEQVKPFLDLGLYIGFSGVITRSGPKKVRKLAEVVLLDRIVAETDSPFIGTATHPTPQSEPADVVEVVAALAAAKGIDMAAMAQATTANARRLFGL